MDRKMVSELVRESQQAERTATKVESCIIKFK